MTHHNRNKLTIAHIALVRVIAKDVSQRVPVHIELGELVSAGTVGLLAATKHFKPDTNVSFGAYAKFRIRGAMLDFLRNEDWASREQRKRLTKIAELNRELERPPTDDEIADALKLPVERYRKTRHVTGLVSLTEFSTGQDPNGLDRHHSPPAAPLEVQPDRIYQRTETKNRLVAAIKTLSPRYQRIITLHYFGGLTMSQVGTIEGCKESRISQILTECRRRLKPLLEEQGITKEATA